MMSVMEAPIASLAQKLKAVTLLFHTTTPSTEYLKVSVRHKPNVSFTCLVLLSLTGSGSNFPIAIDEEDLNFGINTVIIMLTSAGGATATATNFIVRQRLPFNVFCSARSTSDSEYVEISCVLRESSQTIAGVTYAINGVDKGALQGMLVATMISDHNNIIEFSLSSSD